MTRIGYHASHEQFAPSALLRYVKLAEEAGFASAKSSDHFHPWSEKQGQSGFAWTWLGSALEGTRFPIGTITAPGYRYHPAIVAQAIATIGEMYPGRTWVALGSGEAINEAITGDPWPEKAERNARLVECVAVIRSLLAGETVTHRGRITVVEAKLYSRPSKPVPLFGAAMSKATAALVGSWADGILLAGHRADSIAPLVDAFRKEVGLPKPVVVQMAVSWARSRGEAEEEALSQWSAGALGGEVAWDLRRSADFDHAARFVRADDMSDIVLVTDSIQQIKESIAEIGNLGVETVYLHMVGRDQEAFIEEFDRGGRSKLEPSIDEV